MDELFPEEAEDWSPELVGQSRARGDGGLCDHCPQYIPGNGRIFKLHKACCKEHLTEHKKGSKNGPGKWVCEDCFERLVVA